MRSTLLECASYWIFLKLRNSDSSEGTVPMRHGNPLYKDAVGALCKLFAFSSPIMFLCGSFRKAESAISRCSAKDATRTYRHRSRPCRTPGSLPSVRCVGSVDPIFRLRSSEVACRTSCSQGIQRNRKEGFAEMGEMRRAIAREEDDRRKQDRFASTLVIAVSIIAAVRLARDDISRPSPRIQSVIMDSVHLARSILDAIVR
jgi:hypothetical protein